MPKGIAASSERIVIVQVFRIAGSMDWFSDV